MKSFWIPLLLGIIVLGGFFLLRGQSRAAPKPSVFEGSPSYVEAVKQGKEQSKPLFVMVTADWCGPCQTLKRDALSDPAVTQVLRDKTIPVYVDATNALPPEVQHLNVMGFPALYLVRGEQVVAKLFGVVPPSDLSAWLNEHTK